MMEWLSIISTPYSAGEKCNMNTEMEKDRVCIDILNKLQYSIRRELEDIDKWISDYQRYKEIMKERYNRILNGIKDELKKLGVERLVIHQYSEYYVGDILEFERINHFFPFEGWPLESHQDLNELYDSDAEKIRKGYKSEHLTRFLLAEAKEKNIITLKFYSREEDKEDNQDKQYLVVPESIRKRLAKLSRDDVENNLSVLIQDSEIREFCDSAKDYFLNTVKASCEDLDILLYMRAPCRNYEIGLRHKYYCYVPAAPFQQVEDRLFSAPLAYTICSI
jgi:hypothetical protein